MRLKLLLFAAAVCAVFTLSGVIAEGNLLVNGGFDEVQDIWPAGWSRDMWQSDPCVSTFQISEVNQNGNFCALVENTSANDARFIQTVDVAPNTTYKLSGQVKVQGLNPMEGGAGFSILGTYGEFPKVYDTQGEWDELHCYVTTREDQTSMTVAARLGFYSHDTIGSALFDNVSLVKTGSVPDGVTPILLRDDIGGLVKKEPEDGENSTTAIMAFGIVLAICLAAFGLRKWQLSWKTPRQIRRKSFVEGRIAELSGKTPSLRLHKTDWVLMLSLTFIYTAVAFIGLGATKAPQTAYITTGQQESVIFDMGESHTLHILYYSGINEQDHTFTVSHSSDGQQWTDPYDVLLLKGDCFQWKYVTGAYVDDAGEITAPSSDPLAMKGRYVRLTADEPSMSLMEVVFREISGLTIPVISVTCTGGYDGTASDPKLLIDEAATAPQAPGYYNSMYFDEIYHGRTAYEHANSLKTYEWTHPPLGKVLIMLSIELFGMTPFGWRFAGMLAGVLMVPAMYMMGKLLFQKTHHAFLGAFVMAFDMMHLAQTRIATIDSFAVLFILLAYLCMFRYLQMSFLRDGWRTLLPLGLSGFFMGLACASKWVGLYSGAGLAVLFFWSMVRRVLDYRAARIKGGESKKQVELFWKYAVGTLASCLLFFIILPFVIYYFSYIPQFRWEGGLNWDRFAAMQKMMYNYHASLTATHPYQSPFYEWPLMLRPMWYYSGVYVPDGKVSTIMGMGNPLVWWAGAAAAVYALIKWLIPHLTGSKVTDHRPAILFVAATAQFVPWIFITRATFIYHYFASLVFVILCIVYAFEQITAYHPKAGARLQATYMILVLAAFIGFYPFATGVPMSRAWADTMNWFKGLTLPWWNFGGWLRY